MISAHPENAWWQRKIASGGTTTGRLPHQHRGKANGLNVLLVVFAVEQRIAGTVLHFEQTAAGKVARQIMPVVHPETVA